MTRQRRHAYGFTLVEMVMSLAITAILLVSIASAMILASRAVPTRYSPATAAVEGARVLSQIHDELSFADAVVELSDHAVAFTVPDRDGDGSPEVIRYAQAGTLGDDDDPLHLTRAYNRGSPVTVLGTIQSFTLTDEQATLNEILGSQSVSHVLHTAIDIALTPGDADPPASPLSMRVGLLNKPEVLAIDWALHFDHDPTAIDFDGDGHEDWTVDAGGAFDIDSLADGVWNAQEGEQLDTAAVSTPVGVTTVMMRFRSTSRPSYGGSGAVVEINGSAAASNVGPMQVAVRLDDDDTQTLTVSNGAGGSTLVEVDDLPTSFVDARLSIDPVSQTVNVCVNGQDRGTYSYTPESSAGLPFASFGASGGTAQFDAVSIQAEGGSE